jgi:hypothetical protein
MTPADRTYAPSVQESLFAPGWRQRFMLSFMIAAIVTTALAVLVVFTSQSAWQALGIGRGLVAPEQYHYTALLVLLGTTFGQCIGWAAGSALLVYVWLLFGSAMTLRVVQMSMSIVYCGLAVMPWFFYHLLFGQPLAGLPRPGMAAWVQQHYADAYWLLFPGHRVTDLLIIPLLVAVLGLLWGGGERVLRRAGMQTLLLCLILLTSLAVALSLGIHATLVHLRVGA